MSQYTSSDNGTPIDRTVQLTGNATFVVSLPKEWARAQNLDAGSTMYLYPHDDRLVAAPAEVSAHDRTIAIDVDEVEPTERHIRSAYVTGADRITLRNVDGLADNERRTLERTIDELIGIEIAETGPDQLTAENLLTVGELSLPQAIAQLRQRSLELITDAVDAVCTDDSALARRVDDRADDVDRLSAFVHRGFHRGLEDVTEIGRLDTDRTAAFRAYRTARDLERIATQATRIAAVVPQQSTPPDGELRDRLETVRTDVRAVVELALAAESDAAIDARESVREPLVKLGRGLYGSDDPDAALYGDVVCRLEQVADCGVSIAETSDEADSDF